MQEPNSVYQKKVEGQRASGTSEGYDDPLSGTDGFNGGVTFGTFEVLMVMEIA